MKDSIEYNTSEDKKDWFKNHSLSEEQVTQLIRIKVERAKIYQLKEDETSCFDD